MAWGPTVTRPEEVNRNCQEAIRVVQEDRGCTMVEVEPRPPVFQFTH